jgi:beta-barrel assembly-enhancing protease
MNKIIFSFLFLLLTWGCTDNQEIPQDEGNSGNPESESSSPAQEPLETPPEPVEKTSAPEPETEPAEKKASSEDNNGKPLSAMLIENGLPVLLEYAKLLQQFEQGKNDSPKSLVDLAFGAVNTAQSIAIDALPVEEGWQEKTGDRFHDQLTDQVEVISNDKRLNNARSVLQKLKKANRLDEDISLYLIKEKEENAFSSVGGYIYLTTGIFKFLSNDDEMAWLLGHEIAHLTCGHCDRKAKTLHIAQGLGDIVETGANAGLMISAPFGQGDEYEADAKGRDYAEAAGYDRDAGIEVLRRFKKNEGESNALDKMFRSHPFSEERITRLEK